MNEPTITELVARSHANAVAHGWYETWPDGATKAHEVNIPEKLALIHWEISEALEAWRENGTIRRCPHCNGTGRCDECRDRGASDGACTNGCVNGFMAMWREPGDVVEGKPEGFVVELADAVIRIADLCGALGLDLSVAVEAKHAYNVQRPFRHGGKLA